jgi:hypothetical protein
MAELEQQWQHAGEHRFGAAELGMAGRPKRDHQVQQRMMSTTPPSLTPPPFPRLRSFSHALRRERGCVISSARISTIRISTVHHSERGEFGLERRRSQVETRAEAPRNLAAVSQGPCEPPGGRLRGLRTHTPEELRTQQARSGSPRRTAAGGRGRRWWAA